MLPIIPVVKLDVTDIAKEVYADGASDLLKEAQKIGVDVLKTIRLALLPLQATAALQDHLARHISNALAKVPEGNRIPPIRSVALPIMESLRYQEDGELLTEAFINLLSATFDSERFGEAHPAFNKILGQLSSDEAKLIDSLAESELKIYFGMQPLDWAQSSKGIVDFFSQREGDLVVDWRYVINPDALLQPKYLHVYVGHLVSLGVVEYDMGNTNNIFMSLYPGLGGVEKSPVKLTAFGELFHKACIGGISEGITATREHDGV